MLCRVRKLTMGTVPHLRATMKDLYSPLVHVIHRKGKDNQEKGANTYHQLEYIVRLGFLMRQNHLDLSAYHLSISPSIHVSGDKVTETERQENVLSFLKKLMILEDKKSML